MANGPGSAANRINGAATSEVAAATSQPWLDADGFWIGYLRAVSPNRAPVLGYVPKLGDRMVPFDSLELALIDAWVSGGNYLLALEPHFRKALLEGDEKGPRRLARPGPHGALVAAADRSVPPAHLSHHHHAGGSRRDHRRDRQPDVPAERLAGAGARRSAAAARPAHRRALVAVDLKPPRRAVRNRILAHAEAGAAVVVNGDWWQNKRLKKVKSQEDRDFFQLGRGQVVAYRETIDDPGEFALDVIDSSGPAADARRGCGTRAR